MVKRREHAAKRRGPRRQPLPRVLVVCGGVSTEPDYLHGLRLHLRAPAVRIRVVGKGVAPTQLVEYAQGLWRRDPDGFDEVWCVFDVDEFDTADAVRVAARGGIDLAISSPCFELWLLLHHTDHRGYLDDYRDVVTRLCRYVPSYNKASLSFGDYAAGLPDAMERGRALSSEDESRCANPSTGVWRLVQKIMGEDHE